MGELVFNVFLAIIDVIAIIGCFSIQIIDQPMARFWPLGIFAALLVMLVVKIIGLWKKLPEEEKQSAKGLAFLKLKNPRIIRLVLAFILSIIYACLLPCLGYLVCTIIYGTGMAFLLEGKYWWKNILISFVITAILYALFTWGLGIHPARGVGVFAKFSKWLEYLF